MIVDSVYHKKLEEAITTLTPESVTLIETNMGFSYRQISGAHIFTAIIFRSHTTYAVIKLFQYLSSPAHIHFEAVKNIFRYLRNHPNDCLFFWRKIHNTHLPSTPLTHVQSNKHKMITVKHETGTLYGFVDSD